jgi:hypothetical protein
VVNRVERRIPGARGLRIPSNHADVGPPIDQRLDGSAPRPRRKRRADATSALPQALRARAAPERHQTTRMARTFFALQNDL